MALVEPRHGGHKLKARDRLDELDSYFDKGDSQGDKKMPQHTDQDCRGGLIGDGPRKYLILA